MLHEIGLSGGKCISGIYINALLNNNPPALQLFFKLSMCWFIIGNESICLLIVIGALHFINWIIDF